MAELTAKLIRLSDTNRNVFETIIRTTIPEDTKYIMFTENGYYLLLDEDVPPAALGLSIPHFAFFSYYEANLDT